MKIESVQECESHIKMIWLSFLQIDFDMTFYSFK